MTPRVSFLSQAQRLDLISLKSRLREQLCLLDGEKGRRMQPLADLSIQCAAAENVLSMALVKHAKPQMNLDHDTAARGLTGTRSGRSLDLQTIWARHHRTDELAEKLGSSADRLRVDLTSSIEEVDSLLDKDLIRPSRFGTFVFVWNSAIVSILSTTMGALAGFRLSNPETLRSILIPTTIGAVVGLVGSIAFRLRQFSGIKKARQAEEDRMETLKIKDFASVENELRAGVSVFVTSFSARVDELVARYSPGVINLVTSSTHPERTAIGAEHAAADFAGQFRDKPA